MKPERWEQVNQLFHGALERGPHERVAFLEQACASDRELLGQVETLLAAHERAGSFIEHPALEVEAQLIANQKRTADGESADYGEMIDHYRIVERLGAGGMGEVFLAQDLKLGRRVALKLLPQRFAENSERLQRFKQEARAASVLNHPNILTIYEIGKTGATPYIVTEFVDGKTLRAYTAGKPLKSNETISLVIQIGNALTAAHAKGIIHRDIKPENVMLCRGAHYSQAESHVKVLDFGIAKLADAEVVQTDIPTMPMIRTSAGVAIGTTPYMSPEQLRGEAIDARTDIWSLGIVLYEMLAGKLPFDGRTSEDVRAAILKDELSPLPAEVSDALRSIVRKALKKDRVERYQNIGEMLDDLQRLQARTDRTTNTLFRSVSIVAIGLLVLGAVGIAIWSRKSSDGNPKVPAVSFQSAKIMPLTTSGKVIEAAISPDGKYMAHIVNDGGQQSLWVRQIATQSIMEIVPPTEAEYGGLTFSPDGNHIYYVIATKSLPNGALYQVSSIGGVARKVLTGIHGPVSFSPGGKRIAYLTYSFKDAEDVLMIANVDGSNVRRLAGRGGDGQFYRGSGSAVSWSPDGKTIASPVGQSAPENYMTVVTVSVETGEVNFFTQKKWIQIRQVAWLADGKGMLINGGDSGVQPQIWHVSYPEGSARQVTNELNSYLSLSLNANSDALVSVQVEAVANIWVGSALDAVDARQITFGKHVDNNPSWMSNSALVFDSNKTGNMDLHATDIQGADARRFSVSPNFNPDFLAWPTVSPDGRHVAFLAGWFGTPYIWRMDIDGANPQRLTPEIAGNPQWSPDGQWIFYVSFENNTAAVSKVPAGGGQSVPLTKNGWTFSPTVSPDGKQIACYYLADQNSPPKLAVLSSEGGEPTKIFDPQLNFKSIIGTLLVSFQPNLRWTPDGRAVVYVVSRDGVSNLWAQPVDGSPPIQLTNFTKDLIFAFDISPDGKQIALSRGTQTSDVVLISGFNQ